MSNRTEFLTLVGPESAGSSINFCYLDKEVAGPVDQLMIHLML